MCGCDIRWLYSSRKPACVSLSLSCSSALVGFFLHSHPFFSSLFTMRFRSFMLVESWQVSFGVCYGQVKRVHSLTTLRRMNQKRNGDTKRGKIIIISSIVHIYDFIMCVCLAEHLSPSQSQIQYMPKEQKEKERIQSNTHESERASSSFSLLFFFFFFFLLLLG